MTEVIELEDVDHGRMPWMEVRFMPLLTSHKDEVVRTSDVIPRAPFTRTAGVPVGSWQRAVRLSVDDEGRSPLAMPWSP